MLKPLLLVAVVLGLVLLPVRGSSLTSVDWVHFENKTDNCASVSTRGKLAGKWVDYRSRDVTVGQHVTFDFQAKTHRVFFAPTVVALRATVHATAWCSSPVLATTEEYITDVDRDTLKLVRSHGWQIVRD